MPLGVLDCCSFLQKQSKLKVGILFCPSSGVHMFIARGDLSTAAAAAAVLTEGLFMPKCSEMFLAFNCSPHQCISVFPCNIGDSFLLLVCVCRTDLCASASLLTGLGHRHF